MGLFRDEGEPVRLILLGLILTAAGSGRPDFNRDIRPILARHCLACHGGVKRTSGLNLAFRASAMVQAESGERAIVAGDSEASELVRRIISSGGDRMPPEGESLSQDEVDLLRRWIDAGARWPPHWAFGPLVKPELPAVEKETWVRNPIDRFVLARLVRHGLSPSTSADRRTLIRRLALDLTGLPPTRTEIDQHLNARFDRVVDSYLNSPAHGARWGKYWLDAAGYADSNGYFHADTDRPFAWRYRDWVIDALNEDMPFDEFVRWQLAGDRLAGYEPGVEVTQEMVPMLVATHFLRNAPDGTGESDGNPQERQRDRLVVVEGNLVNLASSLLGITVACAKCHDHPFEPVTQLEYYQLQAIFTGIYPDGEDRWLKPQQRLIVAATQTERRAHDERAKPLLKQIKALEESLSQPSVRTREETNRQILELRRKLPAELPTIAGVWELQAGEVAHHLKRRGVYTQPGPVVEPGVPQALAGSGYAYELSAKADRRLAAAGWITSPRHPLLARVTVNRIWQQHFGAGLVTTSENLGASGEQPSHPELLDFLAAWFVEKGWSRKALHRLIVTSATYCQLSTPRREAIAADPDNRLLWRWSIRRLDAEAIRDSMLAVGGLLDRSRGGAYVPTRTSKGKTVIATGEAGARRRSVYVQHRRTQPLTMLVNFDAHPIISNRTRRSNSTVPLQSLALLNSRFARDCAQQFAAQLPRTAGNRITTAFEMAIGRPPRERERVAAQRFLRRQHEVYSGHEESPDETWTDFCQMILASNVFLYVE
jgi:hypothetical protein